LAAPSVTYTFTDATTIVHSEVNQNFTDIINGISDGTKDITISAFTANGAATFNGAVTLGNATGDDITITGRIASDIDPKTAATNTLGDATQTWRALYVDNGATDSGTIYFDAGSTYFIQGNTAILDIGGFTSLDLNTTADIVGGIHTYMAVNNGTIYDEGDPPYSFTGDTDTGMYSEGADQLNFATGGTAALSIASDQVVTVAGTLDVDTINEKTSNAGVAIEGRQSGTAISAGYVGEFISADCSANTSTVTADTEVDVTGMSITLTPGVWILGFNLVHWVTRNASTGNIYSYTVITNSSNTHINNTRSYHYADLDSGGQPQTVATSASRQTVINISSSTTYKVRMNCGVSAATGVGTVGFSGNLTGAMTGDDNESVIYGIRIA